MTHLLVVILHDLDRLPELLRAWNRIGVPGVTLIQSVGGFQAESWLEKIGLGGLGRLLEQIEVRQRTVFSVISDEQLLERAIAEAEAVVEGFDRPHSGILFTLPVGHALGIRKRGQAFERMEASPEAFILQTRMAQHTPVARIVEVLHLEPVIVAPTAPLQEIMEALLARPSVHLACVANESQHLVGVIDLQRLANGFFFSVFPEKFLGKLKDLDQVLQFASQTQVHRAADLMQAPVWVKLDDNLEQAFERMHSQQLPGLPVVDDQYHIVGYINLLELMHACLYSDALAQRGTP